ncbi:MAG: hypothetical protein ACLFNK_05635, partial [Candidatus Woesearchaeota archaeon]
MTARPDQEEFRMHATEVPSDANLRLYLEGSVEDHQEGPGGNPLHVFHNGVRIENLVFNIIKGGYTLDLNDLIDDDVCEGSSDLRDEEVDCEEEPEKCEHEEPEIPFCEIGEEIACEVDDNYVCGSGYKKCEEDPATGERYWSECNIVEECEIEHDKPIIPHLECVESKADDTMTAHFGYENQNNEPVEIPVGEDNRFTGDAEDRGQTTAFHSGRTDSYPNAEFRVNFAEDNITWALRDPYGTLRSVTADKDSERCEPDKQEPVKPVLECVEHNDDGTYTAHFGYDNKNNESVEIQVGDENHFSPGDDAGQVEHFDAGRSDYYPESAFTVDFDGDDIVWRLSYADSTRTATASDAPEQRCDEEAAPSAEDPDQIIPRVECIEKDGAGNHVVHWGYNNPNDENITIESGEDNVIESTGSSKRHIERFLPGTSPSFPNTTFTTSFTEEAEWALRTPGNDDTISAMATPDSPSCTDPDMIKHKPIKIVGECAEQRDDGSYIAHFGYNNQNNESFTITRDTGNELKGDVVEGSTVTEFKPGRTGYGQNESAFSVVFEGDEITWSLTGPDDVTREATVRAEESSCERDLPESDISCDALDETDQDIIREPAQVEDKASVFIPLLTPGQSGSVRLEQPMSADVSQLTSSGVVLMFDIHKFEKDPDVNLLKPEVEGCAINGDKETFNEIFKDVELTMNCDDLSNLSSCFDERGYMKDNMLELIPFSASGYREAAEDIFSETGKFNLSCSMNIATIIDDGENLEQCGEATQEISFALGAGEEKCDERLCLIKDEMNDEFWMSDSYEVVEKLGRTFDVASNICSLVPTISNLMKQVGTTLSTISATVGALVNTVVPAPPTWTCPLYNLGQSFYGAGEWTYEVIYRGNPLSMSFVPDAIGEGFLGQSPFSLGFICDLVQCNADFNDNIASNFLRDGFFTGDAVDLLNEKSATLQSGAKESATSIFYGSCAEDEDCRANREECVDGQCKLLDDDRDHAPERSPFSASISSDNIIYNA